MKTVFITGGSRGIGKETVKVFAKQGYTVIFTYNQSKTEALSLVKEMTEQGFDVHAYPLNVANVSEIENTFLRVQKLFKHVDVLVNNAGVSLTKLVVDVTECEFDNVFDVNVKGAFFATQQALKCGVQSIVNVSSLWGVCGASCESVYSMSKHAVVGLTRSLAEEYPNVYVNAVCPPIVLTDMCKHLSKEDVDRFNKERSKRTYLPVEIAEIIYRLSTSGKTGEITVL